MVLPLLADLAARTAPSATNPYNHINCVNSASGYFNNVRTPAALLVIPALNSLWLDLSSTTKRTTHPVAQTLYTLSVMLSVLLELVCVFVATVAGTRLLSGGFDPMGPDAVTLLVREFELDYLTTHLAFIFGLAAFMSSIGLRAWIQFGDTSTRMGKAYTMLTITFVANMAAYFHASISRFHLGLPGLMARFLVLYLQSFGLVGVVSFGAVGFVTFLVYQTLREQLHLHGAPTAQLSVQELPQLQDPTHRRNPSGGSDKWRGWQPMTEAERKSK